MQNKIVIYCENQNKLAKVLGKIEKFLLTKGLFDFSFLTCSLYADCLSFCLDAKKFSDTTVVICENENIDKLVEAVKQDDDQLTVVDEQALKLEETTTFRKFLFIPMEVDFEKFLNDFLPQKQTFCFQVFGKTESFIKQKLENLKLEIDVDFDYKIITNSMFLHTVFTSKQIENEKLKTVFEENIFAQTQDTIAKCCEKILKDKNLSVAFAENISDGNLTAKFLRDCDKNLLKSSVQIFNDNSFSQLQIEREFLDEKGTVSKECAFVMAKNLLKISGAEIALAVTGYDCDGGRSFIAVGNKEEIHVYSSVFYGQKEQIKENVCDFALFRLLCFLNEKYV